MISVERLVSQSQLWDACGNFPHRNMLSWAGMVPYRLCGSL